MTAVIGAVYNGVTGYFGDILSYSRLRVMMLAGSVIGLSLIHIYMAEKSVLKIYKCYAKVLQMEVFLCRDIRAHT